MSRIVNAGEAKKSMERRAPNDSWIASSLTLLAMIAAANDERLDP
jgi:hypothetical protein